MSLNIRAEVMAIGDEITSGQRLDTNTQWISQALGELGIAVHFHSTVGDDLADHVSALKIAIERAAIVILSGGLGPTADDLTREAMAQATAVPLQMDEGVLSHIEKIYQRHGREMPASNRAQAYFPEDSAIIPNPEGTAPGIEMTIGREGRIDCRLFALPGVPAEMKQMWLATVEPRLRELVNVNAIVHHHTLHCFGMGESNIESMLPGLIQRGRDPRVGITASAATISLRVSTRGDSKADCLKKMQPTIATIRDRLGDLVFGEEGQSLEEVVLSELHSKQWTLAIADCGLDGEVAAWLSKPGLGEATLKGHQVAPTMPDLVEGAKTIREKFAVDVGLAIGPVDWNEMTIAAGESFFELAISAPEQQILDRLRFGGHSDWRKQRAVKQVLNRLRLFLRTSSGQ